MKRTFFIMTGNLGEGFEMEFAKEYSERLIIEFRCRVADGYMEPIGVEIREGSGTAPKGNWESDIDEDVIREVADDVYGQLVKEYNDMWVEELVNSWDELDELTSENE